MSINFKSNPQLGEALLDWWQNLEDDRASRAVLRRADNVTVVALSPAFQRLRRRLVRAGWPSGPQPGWRDDRLAAIAGLLSHVKVNDDRQLPQAMSQTAGEKPRVSELRFVSPALHLSL